MKTTIKSIEYRDGRRYADIEIEYEEADDARLLGQYYEKIAQMAHALTFDNDAEHADALRREKQRLEELAALQKSYLDGYKEANANGNTNS